MEIFAGERGAEPTYRRVPRDGAGSENRRTCGCSVHPTEPQTTPTPTPTSNEQPSLARGYSYITEKLLRSYSSSCPPCYYSYRAKQ